MSRNILAVALLASLALAGCKTTGSGDGSPTYAQLTGKSLSGGVLEATFGADKTLMAALTTDDEKLAVSALGKAAANPVGSDWRWSNAKNDHAGMITVDREVVVNGETCRLYTQVVYVDDHEARGKGKVCHRPDKTWRLDKQG